MTNDPYASVMHTSYENFEAFCPLCGHRNVFNRASDLRDLSPIDFRTVTCEGCAREFNINCDSISPAHATLLLDCYRLMDEKHYAYCILNIAQAYESFFSLYLTVELVFRPFWRERAHDLDGANRLSENLERLCRDQAFAKMRGLFLNQIVLTRALMRRSPSTLAEAAVVLSQLRNSDPPDEAISAAVSSPLKELLVALKSVRAPAIRNKVVHRLRYLPNREEVDMLLEEARSLIFPLSYHLNVDSDEINAYSSTA